MRRVALLVVIILATVGAPVAAASSPPIHTSDAVIFKDDRTFATQSPAFVAAKNDHRVGRLDGEPFIASSPFSMAAWPSSMQLNITYVTSTIEPEDRLYDDTGSRAINDSNYWNFCGPGGSTISLRYWPMTAGNITGYPAAFHEEPTDASVRQRTYWEPLDYGTTSDTHDGYATYGRSYLMYLAEEVNPGGEWPSTATGEIRWSDSPVGTYLPAIRDALNWEASGHSGFWQSFFYMVRDMSAAIPSSELLDDVETDINSVGVPVVVSVYTSADVSGINYHLPNWGSQTHIRHIVSIVGYNNSSGTYTYLDTCGIHCGSSSNGGPHTVSQSTLYKLLGAAHNGFVW